MNLVSLLSLCVLVGACAGPTSAPNPAPAPAPEASPAPRAVPAAAPAPDPAAPPREGESRVLQGVLHYTELPPRKSVEAFLGQDLTLVEGDESWNVNGTEQVSDEQLQALDGKRVEITATYVPPRVPDPHEQAPMDGDGLMSRPERWDVTAVKVLAE